MAVEAKELYTKLTDAIKKNNVQAIDEYIKLYIDSKLDLDFVPKVVYLTPLELAVTHGNLGTIEKLINSGADVNHVSSRRNGVALIKAIESENLNVVSKLIEMGADVNPDTVDSPLSIAVGSFENNPEAYLMVDLLLKNGADPGSLPPEDIVILYDEYPELFNALKNGDKFSRKNYVAAAYKNKRLPIERYEKTGRPKTKMTFVQLNCPPGSYLPVVRYDTLYYSRKPREKEQYCGTFYYYEPNSLLFINLGNVLVAANKIDAYIQLTGVTFEELFKRGKDNEAVSQFWTPKDRHFISRYLEFAEDREFAKQFITELIPNEKNIFIINDDYNGRYKLNALLSTEEDRYIGENLQGLNAIVGIFDYIDQLICPLAQEQGYDTILLQREPGETRMVSEILDVRPRDVSYQSFCLIDNGEYTKLADQSEYPTIWFTDYGFINRN